MNLDVIILLLSIVFVMLLAICATGIISIKRFSNRIAYIGVLLVIISVMVRLTLSQINAVFERSQANVFYTMPDRYVGYVMLIGFIMMIIGRFINNYQTKTKLRSSYRRQPGSGVRNYCSSILRTETWNQDRM